MQYHSNPKPPKGWIKAIPLENYSSLNKLSLLPLLGLDIDWPKREFFVQFSFNLKTPLVIHPDAYLTFHTRDIIVQSLQKPCYTITNLKRWRLNISAYKSIDDFLDNTIRWHRCNYLKSKKTFEEYGCRTTYLEDDWSAYVEQVYLLYANVANLHGDWLYDLNFFKEISRRSDYKLLCAWHGDELIGFFVHQVEFDILHSVCCGFDYKHSSACYAYSWLNYVHIQIAIASQFKLVDVGLTANESKKAIGFSSVPACMDVYSRGFGTKNVLRLLSLFTHCTIDTHANLKFKLGRSSFNSEF